MHYVLLASLLLAFPAFASEKCQRVEYAELQDMSTDEQTVYFCKVQSSHWYNALLVDNIRKVYKGNETFMDQRKRDELREDLTALEACKAALDSVSRLLRRKNIDPDGIQCEKGLPKKPGLIDDAIKTVSRTRSSKRCSQSLYSKFFEM